MLSEYEAYSSPPNNGSSNRADQNPTPRPRPHAARQPLPPIQCVRQTRLSLQGPRASAPPWSLLPAQLRLSRKEDLQVHPSRSSEPGADRTRQLQKVPAPNRPLDRVGPSGR